MHAAGLWSCAPRPPPLWQRGQPFSANTKRVHRIRRWWPAEETVLVEVATPLDGVSPKRGAFATGLAATRNGQVAQPDGGRGGTRSAHVLQLRLLDAVAELYALIGCAVLDKAYILVASQIPTVVSLPFGGAIHQVEEWRWIPFELPGVVPEFEEYSFEKGYYYPDDVDSRLQFPFVRARDAHVMPDFKYDWSQPLRMPFRTASMRTACSVLLRGFASERACAMKDGTTQLHMMPLGRQNSVNPGPRYLGRGLNAVGGAGNDHFYEFVIWKRKGDESAVTFSRHAILRGTVPVHWTTQVSMSISEPAMIFSSNKSEVLKGGSAYFDNVFANLQQVMHMDSGGKTTRNPQVRCINLLRLNPAKRRGHPCHALPGRCAHVRAKRKAGAPARYPRPRSRGLAEHNQGVRHGRRRVEVLGVCRWLSRKAGRPGRRHVHDRNHQAPADGADEAFAAPVRSEHLVVIEFHPSSCTFVNAPASVTQTLPPAPSPTTDMHTFLKATGSTTNGASLCRFCQAMPVSDSGECWNTSKTTFTKVHDALAREFHEDGYQPNHTVQETEARRLRGQPWAGEYYRGDAFDASEGCIGRACCLCTAPSA